MNNTIMRKIVVTGTYAPLVSESLVGSVTISCLPTNAGDVFFKGDDGTDVPWKPGQWIDFRRIDLAKVEIKGTPGAVVTAIGGTW
jgi:hypothetical protein